jgi:hypothetical protein
MASVIEEFYWTLWNFTLPLDLRFHMPPFRPTQSLWQNLRPVPQGVQFRQADVLILRMGFIQKYMSLSQSPKNDVAGKPERLLVSLVRHCRKVRPGL